MGLMKKIKRKFDLEKFVNEFKNKVGIHVALSKAYGYKDIDDDNFLKFNDDFLWAMLDPYLATSVFEENFQPIDKSFNYIPIIAICDEHPFDEHQYRLEYGLLTSKKTKYSFLTYFNYSFNASDTIKTLTSIKVFNKLTKEKINQLPLSLDIFLRKDSHLQSGDPCQDILLNKKFKWNFEKVKKYFNKALKEKKRTKVLTSKDQYINGLPDSYYYSDFSGLPDSYYNINFYLIDTKKFYKNKFLKSKIIFQLK